MADSPDLAEASEKQITKQTLGPVGQTLLGITGAHIGGQVYRVSNTFLHQVHPGHFSAFANAFERHTKIAYGEAVDLEAIVGRLSRISKKNGGTYDSGVGMFYQNVIDFVYEARKRGELHKCFFGSNLLFPAMNIVLINYLGIEAGMGIVSSKDATKVTAIADLSLNLLRESFSADEPHDRVYPSYEDSEMLARIFLNDSTDELGIEDIETALIISTCVAISLLQTRVYAHNRTINMKDSGSEEVKTAQVGVDMIDGLMRRRVRHVLLPTLELIGPDMTWLFNSLYDAYEQTYIATEGRTMASLVAHYPSHWYHSIVPERQLEQARRSAEDYMVELDREIPQLMRRMNYPIEMGEHRNKSITAVRRKTAIKDKIVSLSSSFVERIRLINLRAQIDGNHPIYKFSYRNDAIKARDYTGARLVVSTDSMIGLMVEIGNKWICDILALQAYDTGGKLLGDGAETIQQKDLVIQRIDEFCVRLYEESQHRFQIVDITYDYLQKRRREGAKKPVMVNFIIWDNEKEVCFEFRLYVGKPLHPSNPGATGRPLSAILNSATHIAYKSGRSIKQVTPFVAYTIFLQTKSCTPKQARGYVNDLCKHDLQRNINVELLIAMLESKKFIV